MDLDVTKRAVVAEETVFEQRVEQGVEFESTLPDYCGGIRKILRSQLVPRVGSVSKNGQNITIEGTACLSVIYEDEDGALGGWEDCRPFSKNLDIGEDADCRVSVEPTSGYLNVRAQAPRKLDVKSVVALAVTAVKSVPIETVSDVSGEGVFVRRESIEAQSPVCTAEKNVVIEEEIALGASQPAVERQIRTDVSAEAVGCRMISGKAIIKGELRVQLLYFAEGRPEKFSTAVPFSQIVDAEGADEDCECEASVRVISAEVRPRSADGAAGLMLDARLCVTACVTRKTEIETVNDAFSKGYELSLKRERLALKAARGNISETFSCRKKLDFSDGDAESVIDMWCDADLRGCRGEGEQITADGAVTVRLLTRRSDGGTAFFERPIDFEYRCAAGTNAESLLCKPNVSAVAASYTIAGDNAVEVRVDLQISGAVYETVTADAVTDMEIAGEKPASDVCPLTVYYAAAGESLWDVAKRYGASPDEIAAINSLPARLDADTPILIPVG